jgi:hypothetical protein
MLKEPLEIAFTCRFVVAHRGEKVSYPRTSRLSEAKLRTTTYVVAVRKFGLRNLS